MDLLEFYIRCNSSFPYARGEEPVLRVRVTAQDMLTRAFFEDLHDDEYPHLENDIRRRYPPAPPA